MLLFEIFGICFLASLASRWADIYLGTLWFNYRKKSIHGTTGVSDSPSVRCNHCGVSKYVTPCNHGWCCMGCKELGKD